MKLKTKVGSLIDALNITAPTLDRKGASAHLYMEANATSGYLYFYSTNLIAETSTKIKSEVEKSGKVLVNPSKLFDGLSGLDRESSISLTLTGTSLRIVAGSVKFSLASSADVEQISAKMRTIPSKADPISVILTSEIAEFTKRSQFCISNDQTGRAGLAGLTAMKICDTEDKEEAFATDGTIAVYAYTKKHIGKKTYKGLGASGILLPTQTIQALSQISKKKKGETVSILTTEKSNKIYFKFADDTYYGVLTLAAQFPNIKGIMDSQSPQYTCEIPRKSLVQTLGRANAFITPSASQKVLELELTSDKMNIKAVGEDSLSDALDVTYKKDKPTSPVLLGVNIDYLMNIASSSDSEYLSLGFTSSNAHLVVTDTQGEEDDEMNVKYVMMGVKVGPR